MKKNIVLIETETGMGTGILYPCKYEYKEPRTNTFIIFTNKHVIEEMEGDSNSEDVKDYCMLHIYDEAGNKIEKEEIKKVLVHAPGTDIYLYNDIAALLVCISDTVSVVPEMKVFEKELANREVLYMEGYPGVMLEDEVSQKVQLQGMAKSIFPANDKMGVYQITDDYHWYNDFKDHKLMKGFSGGPVYIERNGMFYLIGMNQSVSDIHAGENPFKLAYYIKARHILEYLRDTNGIIFRKERNETYTIEWIADLHEEMCGYENEPTLLLIGGSGAGKSSFALDFAYSKKKIHATNDGQTTRTNVVYDYSLVCDRAKAKICFFDGNSFVEHMRSLVGVKPYTKIWESIFCERKNDSKDDMYYIKNMYYYLRGVSEKNKIKRIEKVLLTDSYGVRYEDGVSEKNDVQVTSNDEIEGIYEDALHTVLERLPLGLVKFVCDKNYLDELLYDSSDEEKERDAFREELYKKVKGCVGEIAFSAPIVEKIVNNIISYRKTKDFCDYQLKWKEIDEDFEEVRHDNYLMNINCWLLSEVEMELHIKKELLTSLFEIAGFFSLKEFEVSTEEVLEAINDCEVFKFKDSTMEVDYESIYQRVFNILMRKAEKLKNFNVEKIDIGGKKRERKYIEIDLAEMSEEDEKILSQCLQVTNENKTWTGIIKTVYVHDRISNDYALMMKQLRLKRLRILDTCGLDHISRESKISHTLYDIKVRFEMDYGIKSHEYSVVYVKKLDSGKPDELRNIIPQVYKVIPQAPIYCVFTGIDIFYQGKETSIEQINWSERNLKNCPKMVKYIYENKEELVGGMVCSSDRKKYMYSVLKNNLIPFCGTLKDVYENYSYYASNQRYVRSLLNSIIIKEYNCLEIVDKASLEKYLNESNRVERFLERMFDKASENDWERIHHRTVAANYTRLTREKEKQLGFWRTFKQQWNQIFEHAYAYVANRYVAELLEEFDGGKDAVEAEIINISSSYLGDIYNLWYWDVDEKNEFRMALEEMYAAVDDMTREKIYAYNPFVSNDNAEKMYQINEMRNYMREVGNFAKGFQGNAEIRKRFVDFFITTLCNAVDKTNESKIRNISALNEEFVKGLSELMTLFDEKYGMNQAKVKLVLKSLEYQIEKMRK